MSYKITLDESQRQIVLLALAKLMHERPGWSFAIGEITDKLGGQLDWPVESLKYSAGPCLSEPCLSEKITICKRELDL